MEFIAVLLLIVILVILLSFRNQFSERMLRLETEVRRLREQVAKSMLSKPTGESAKPTATASPVVTPAPPVPQTWQSGFKMEEESDKNIAVPPAGAAMKETAVPAEAELFIKPVPIPQKSAATQAPFIPQNPLPEPEPGFFERHPDLEKFIGENLVSKIGIAVLVLAIAYFVKYAIDKDWISTAGRVGIGLLCGGILITFGHFTRNNYKAFSSVLVGGGLAVFYFTISLAYHQFGFFTQSAFFIMLAITAFAVALSYIYNRQEVAIIALVGGFTSPFMVSNGSDNYVALFIYLIVLNLGLLAIAYKKAWRLLNLLAFVFTVILFAGWLFTLDENEAAIAYRNAFIFASIFYLLFFVINIAHNIREQKKFIASDFGILLANTGLYFGTGLFCLTEIYAEEFRGLFCIIMGAFNLTASYLFFRKNKVDGNILYLLIGITLTFISLTAPIQLNGNNITLFWATETVLLYWLYQKSGIAIIRVSSFIIWGCMLISLVMDWNAVYSYVSVPLTIVANKGFITTLCTAISSLLLFIFCNKDPEKPAGFNWLPRAFLYLTVSLVLFFLAGFLEINHQFRNHYPSTQLYALYLLFYTLTFILIVKLISAKDPFNAIHPRIITGLLLTGVIVYLVSVPSSYYIQRQMLEQQVYGTHYAVHWLNALLTGAIIYLLFRNVRNMKDTALFTWLFCAVIVIFFTVEIHLIADALFFSPSRTLPEIQRVFTKTGWTILWSVCSFVFMWLGMRNKFRTLRIISLTLFTVSLIKLFVYDISNMPPGGKIAAFFSLGVLLLVVSFMYQRLKKIIIDNEEKTTV